MIKILIQQFKIDEAKELIEIGRTRFEEASGDFNSLFLYCNFIEEKYDLVITTGEALVKKYEDQFSEKEPQLKPDLNRIAFCLACAYLEKNDLEKYQKYIKFFNKKYEHAPLFLTKAKYYFKMCETHHNCASRQMLHNITYYC